MDHRRMIDNLCRQVLDEGQAVTHREDLLAAEVRRLQAELNHLPLVIPCARCGRTILAIDSKGADNEEMDVCGPCGSSTATEVLEDLSPDSTVADALHALEMRA